MHSDKIKSIIRPLLVAFSVCLTACDGGDQPEPLKMVTMTLAPHCDVGQGCLARAGGFHVQFRIGSQARALTPFPVHVQIEDGAEIEAVTVTFSMKGMEMGLNRYRLQQQSDGRWNADVILPICTSGRSDWIVGLELSGVERRYSVDIPFVLGG
jgi:hypothetical protein